jgi:large subunit ribosomal protein L9e
MFINPRMGKSILLEEHVEIPEGVTVTIKSGHITVKGPKGTLKKKLPKAPVLYRESTNSKKKKSMKISMFLANRKRQSCVVALSKFILNMIKGVTVGFEYKLRYGFNILPARPEAIEKGKAFSISNYMGQKDVHIIKCPEGVFVRNGEDPKMKEVYVSGIDIQYVGQMASMITQKCVPRNLDRRVFRDGIYIENRGTIEKED